MMKSKLLVVGNSYMEIVVWVDAIPGADVGISDNNSYTRRPGGRGACSAVAASRMGMEVALCSVIGKDEDGVRLKDYLNNNNVDTSSVRTDRKGTGISVHLHENTFMSDRKILCPGANSALDGDIISYALDKMPSSMFITTELPYDIIVDASKVARKRGISVILDATGAKYSPMISNIENIELFITDAAGIKSLVGVNVTGADKCLPAAIALANKVAAKYYIFKLGTLGTFIYDGKYQQHVFPCPLECRTYGAPVDTESAVIAAAYLSSGDIKKSCSLAAVMAKMSKEDPKVKMPTMTQAVEYCKNNGIRFD